MSIEVKYSEKLVDYMDSMEFMEKRVADVLKGKKKELLWILEHKKVFTAGTSSQESDLLDKNIKLIKTDRGGKITLHAPGQKVVYFVLNLNKRKKDIRDLVSKIENCVINVLKKYNIKSFPYKKNIGIWVNINGEVKKISAIGIRVKKWIAYHGFSINISNDISEYDKIVPCGIKNKGIANFDNLKVKDYKNINNIITEEFLKIFL